MFSNNYFSYFSSVFFLNLIALLIGFDFSFFFLIVAFGLWGFSLYQWIRVLQQEKNAEGDSVYYLRNQKTDDKGKKQPFHFQDLRQMSARALILSEIPYVLSILINLLYAYFSTK